MRHEKVKKRRINPALLLFLVSIAAVFIFGIYFLRQHDTDTVIREKESMTVTAPKLSAAADAFLLVHKEDAILIDTGEQADGPTLMELLKSKGITHLKALILTHFDKDHIGGAADVLKNVTVDRCYMTCGSEDSEEYDALMDALDENGCEQLMMTEKTTFSALGGEFTIYPPRQYSYEENNDNNRSLIISIAYEGKELLFTGDAQKARMDEFLENQYDGTKYDFVKIPHHGRSTQAVEDMLAKFQPTLSVITSSEEEAADDEVVSLLKDSEVDVWYPKDGDLEMEVNSEDIVISQDGESVTYNNTASDKESEAATDTAAGSETEAGSDTAAGSETEAGSDTAAEAETTAATESTAAAVSVEAPVFSANSGFYEDPFDLSIDAPEGTTIYYTTDSSTPTTASAVYQSAITVTDASQNANVYSVRTDLEPYRASPLYSGQSPVLSNYYPRYLTPQVTVDKCTVIRAMAVDAEGNCSAVTTASYFVGYGQKEGYENVSVMSIVSDPDGLFSSDSGIMVNGTTYNTKLLNGELYGISDSHDLRKFTNTYTGRGRDWEREAHIDFFGEGDLNLIFSQEAGIRLHGNLTRVTEAQKSFNLYAREEYDGNGTFLAPFFEDGILQDTVTLMRGSDIRNYYVASRMNGREMDSQQYRMVQVFLDGEYWGFYAIQERYSSNQYMKTHYGLDKGDYSLFSGGPKGFKYKKGDEMATKTSFVMLKAYVADHDLSNPQVYEKVCSMMDVQSFIDVYAARIYTGDQDWSWFKNQYLLYYDNKWHWLIYDMDYGTGSHDTSLAEIDTFNTNRLIERYSLANDPLFSYLMQNEQFRKDFVNTFMDLANDVFDASQAKKDKDAFLEQYWNATIKSIERYPLLGQSVEEYRATHTSSYANNFDEIEDYFEDRYDYAAYYLKNYFSLAGNLANVTLGVSDTEGGSVKINTISPSLGEDGSWSGKYYTDYPVNVTAVPAEGWVFAGWQCEGGNVVDAASATTELSFTEDTWITAVFEKE